jgi:hypothetical protein
MTEQLTPFTHPRVVLAHLKALNDVLIPSLGYCCRRSTGYFREQNLSFEGGLHSYLTRHRLIHILRLRSIAAELEQDGSDYTAEGQALCGIRIETDQCVIKLLKHPSRKKELPAFTTEQRRDFYQANLGFGDLVGSDQPEKLNLISLWNADAQHELSSFAVACPYGTNDRRPQKKWWKNLDISAFSFQEDFEPEASEPELNEITPRLQAVDTAAEITTERRSIEEEDQQDEGPAVAR